MITLKELGAEIAVSQDYKDLTDLQWDVKTTRRGLNRRSQKDFDWLQDMYPKKITELREKLKGEWNFDVRVSDDGKVLNSPAVILDAVNAKMDDWYSCNLQEQNIVDKLACVINEQRLRKEEFVVRTDTHEYADFYCDYGVAADDQDGSAPDSNAFKTVTHFTQTITPVPGDRLLMRAGVTWPQGTLATDIVLGPEDGTLDLYISIVGCGKVGDGDEDPWADDVATKPIIDFEDAAYNVVMSASHYWYLERLDFQNCADNSGAIVISGSDYCYFKDINIQDNYAVTVEGFAISNSEMTTLDGCTFLDCFGYATTILNSKVLIKNCTYTAGTSVSTDGGLFVTSSNVWVQDTTFAGSFDILDIRGFLGAQIYMRNVTRASANVQANESAEIYSEDDDGTFESHISTFIEGTITRGTGAGARAGGADSYAIMTPTAYCGLNRPLTLGKKLSGFARVWMAANAASTITVWVRVGVAWTGALTDAQCFLTASYLDDATGNVATRTKLQSTETISNVADWTTGVHELTVTIPASNPKRDGWVYLWLTLTHWEDAADVVWVDIKPVIS